MNNGSRDTSHSDIQKLQQQLQDIKEQVILVSDNEKQLFFPSLHENFTLNFAFNCVVIIIFPFFPSMKITFFWSEKLARGNLNFSNA